LAESVAQHLGGAWRPDFRCNGWTRESRARALAGLGGGIANLHSATTTVDSSYLANNQANGDGGGAGLAWAACSETGRVRLVFSERLAQPLGRKKSSAGL
jgi:hypothetical protein